MNKKEGMKAFDLGEVNPDAPANQRLYRLDPPMKTSGWDDEEDEHEYVVVSAVDAFSSNPGGGWAILGSALGGSMYGPGEETFIFAADKDGNVTNWGELDRSYKGGLDHEAALERAGYVVVPCEEDANE